MFGEGVWIVRENGQQRFFGILVLDAKERVLLWRFVSS